MTTLDARDALEKIKYAKGDPQAKFVLVAELVCQMRDHGYVMSKLAGATGYSVRSLYNFLRLGQALRSGHLCSSDAVKLGRTRSFLAAARPPGTALDVRKMLAMSSTEVEKQHHRRYDDQPRKPSVFMLTEKERLIFDYQLVMFGAKGRVGYLKGREDALMKILLAAKV